MGFHRRLAPTGFDRGAGAFGIAACVMSAAAAALGTLPASAAPQDDTRAEVDRLYTQAEKATEAFNKADERADTLRRQIGTAQDEIARQQDRINTMREALGSLAGAQYRSGGIDPSLALLFSDDPADYLDKAAALDRITSHQAGELRDLQIAMRDLSQKREEAGGKLAELESSRKAVAQNKRTVERKLAKARRLLNSLPDADRAAYDRASRSTRADLPGFGSDAPSSDAPPPLSPPPARPSAAPTSGARTGRAASTVRASCSGPTRGPVSACRAPRRPSGTPDARCRCPRRSRATSSPTGPTPAMSGCTWATAR